MIRAADLCAIEVIDVNRPNSLTPGGMKGMSEGGVMGAIGALANAINDALGAGRPVVYTQPFTAERLWRALRP
jgi:carbon-monoxide dehydrogenase large subunit